MPDSRLSIYKYLKNKRETKYTFTYTCEFRFRSLFLSLCLSICLFHSLSVCLCAPNDTFSHTAITSHIDVLPIVQYWSCFINCLRIAVLDHWRYLFTFHTRHGAHIVVMPLLFRRHPHRRSIRRGQAKQSTFMSAPAYIVPSTTIYIYEYSTHYTLLLLFFFSKNAIDIKYKWHTGWI